jgi:formylglycine-generating enzyme required for sulfatase activity
VTNAEFKKFIDATNYITTAEKDFRYKDPKGNIILQKAGALVFWPKKDTQNTNPGDWWKFVEGANWKHPQGPGSSIIAKENYPVVQISWEDAQAYCIWAHKRLPTEAEWEYAARAGFVNNVYTWGNEKNLSKSCNSWDGNFPVKNTEADGYMLSAPVKTYPANNFGLYDMAGNVWEWCADSYNPDYYNYCKTHKFENGNLTPSNELRNAFFLDEKVIRGGSFLCNDSYCSGFRVSARMKTDPLTSLEHTGFRCVRDVK